MPPGESSRPKKKGTSELKKVFSYMARYKLGLAVGAMCLVISNVLLLANPWILKLTIDSLQKGMTGGELFTLILLLVAATSVSGVFRFLMRRIMIGISRKIEVDLRSDFFSHLQRMSSSFYLRNKTGDLMALATNDLNAVRALVGPGVMYSMNTVVVACFAIALMMVLSLKLTILALFPMLLLSLAVYRSVRVIHRLFEKVQEKFAHLNSRAQENLSGIRVVKAYAREESELKTFRDSSLSYVKANMKLFRVQSLLMPLLTFVAGLGSLVVLTYGGKQVIDGELTLGAFVAFNGYLVMMIWPMIAVGWVMNITQRGKASMGRINRVLEEEPEVRDPVSTGINIKSPRDFSIAFENVSFTYPTKDGRMAALNNVSLFIKSGEKVAIVGPTGAGKSTLISLILRRYDPSEGRVLVGGVPIEEIPLRELRSVMGVVPQDIFLFSDTILSNITFGATELSYEEVERLGSLCSLKEEVEGFPRRYETLIGERGVNLSGGQKQRVAIARALARDPRIFIMDDALSSVDADTEEKILKSLDIEMKRRTTIIVSHRISTVRGADRIFVLDEGSVAEQGTHDELISLGGVYAEMQRKQVIAASLNGSS